MARLMGRGFKIQPTSKGGMCKKTAQAGTMSALLLSTLRTNCSYLCGGGETHLLTVAVSPDLSTPKQNSNRQVVSKIPDGGAGECK